jgi:hypothetical protein
MKTNKSKAIIAHPAHKPLMPSIILNAFMIPTTQNIVKGMLNIPRLISPKPNKFPKDSSCIPVEKIT